jgi:HAMP domain-containing protein
MRRNLFLVMILVGGVPLALSTVWLIRDAPREGRLIETAWIVVVAAALLVLLAAFLSRNLSFVLRRELSELGDAMSRLDPGEQKARERNAIVTRELQELSLTLDQLTRFVQEHTQNLRRTEQESRGLATDSLKLFAEAAKGRAPHTKPHPGLAGSFSRALAVQQGHLDEGGKAPNLLDSLLDTLDQEESDLVERRTCPRYSGHSLQVDTPVLAKVIDLSATGMGLEGLHKPPFEGENVFSVLSDADRIEIRGKVCWCKLVSTLYTTEGDTLPVYRAGISFGRRLPPNTRARLLRTLEGPLQVA